MKRPRAGALRAGLAGTTEQIQPLSGWAAIKSLCSQQLSGISTFSVQRGAASAAALEREKGEMVKKSTKESMTLSAINEIPDMGRLPQKGHLHNPFLDEIVSQTGHTMGSRLIFLFDFTPKKWALGESRLNSVPAIPPRSPSQAGVLAPLQIARKMIQ